MKHITLIIISILLFDACSVSEKEWKQVDVIPLGDITPIGLAFQNDTIWLSDVDHNQMLAVDSKGTILITVTEFNRPMHIDTDRGILYVSEYGSDQIIAYSNAEKSRLEIPDSLDAPAGVDVVDEEMAIADFYNHRIIYFNGKDWTSFGTEGKGKGELYYPTDVQILSSKIVVADAYNNRIQIFDKQGNSIQIIAESEKINAATGVFANEEEIFITDFENDRVLIYNQKGELLQIISENIDKPTDLVVKDDILYIANYKEKNILKLKK